MVVNTVFATADPIMILCDSFSIIYFKSVEAISKFLIRKHIITYSRLALPRTLCIKYGLCLNFANPNVKIFQKYRCRIIQ
jgi:hypothetical protein